MSEVIIRQATFEDIEEILPLWQEMMGFHTKLDERFRQAENSVEICTQAFKSILKNSDCCVLVAEVEKQLVGYIVGKVKTTPIFVPSHYGDISDICVSPEWRRSGIGRKLFESLRLWFKEKHIEHLEAGVAHGNPVSQAFWRSMGFEDYIDIMWHKL